MTPRSNIDTIIKQTDKSNKLISDDSEAWISWGFYVSPMMYAQNALVLNEFLDKRWSMVSSLDTLFSY